MEAIAIILGLCFVGGIACAVAASSLRFMSDADLLAAYNAAERALKTRTDFILTHHHIECYRPDGYDRSLLVERNKYRDEIARREARRA